MTSKSKFFSVATTTRTYVSLFFLTLGDRLFSGFAGLLKPPAQSGCRMPDAGCRLPRYSGSGFPRSYVFHERRREAGPHLIHRHNQSRRNAARGFTTVPANGRTYPDTKE